MIWWINLSKFIKYNITSASFFTVQCLKQWAKIKKIYIHNFCNIRNWLIYIDNILIKAFTLEISLKFLDELIVLVRRKDFFLYQLILNNKQLINIQDQQYLLHLHSSEIKKKTIKNLFEFMQWYMTLKLRIKSIDKYCLIKRLINLRHKYHNFSIY